jgi:predicted HTH transcriptional regulator
LVAALSAFLVYRKKRGGSSIKFVSADYASQISELIKQGESTSLEFKSTLRWDLREEKVNKKLEEVILKSVSAFNNGEGGTLIIGVEDDGNILGLENDIATLKKQNIDYFELHLRNLLNQTFGVNYTTRNVEILFPEINGKNICVVNVKKGEKPLFITVHDKQGKKIEKFFVRSGNSSQEISSLSEMNEYIKNRFE